MDTIEHALESAGLAVLPAKELAALRADLIAANARAATERMRANETALVVAPEFSPTCELCGCPKATLLPKVGISIKTVALVAISREIARRADVAKKSGNQDLREVRLREAVRQLEIVCGIWSDWT